MIYDSKSSKRIASKNKLNNILRYTLDFNNILIGINIENLLIFNV